MRNALESETSRRILDTSNSIYGHGPGGCQHDGDQHRTSENSLSDTKPGLWQRNDFRADEKVKSGADGKGNRVSHEPESVAFRRLDLFAMLFACRPFQLFANLGSFTEFLRCFCHHDWNRSARRNRPHAPRHFASSKPLNLPPATNLKSAIKHRHCGVARATGGTRTGDPFSG